MFAAWRLVPVSRYIYICVCVHAWMDGWMNGWMHACMHVCVYLCTYIYIMYYYVISRVSWITVVHLQLRWTNPLPGLNLRSSDMASAHTCWLNPPIYKMIIHRLSIYFPLGKYPKSPKNSSTELHLVARDGARAPRRTSRHFDGGERWMAKGGDSLLGKYG